MIANQGQADQTFLKSRSSLERVMRQAVKPSDAQYVPLDPNGEARELQRLEKAARRTRLKNVRQQEKEQASKRRSEYARQYEKTKQEVKDEMTERWRHQQQDQIS